MTQNMIKMPWQKRYFDITVSMFLFIILLPLLLFILTWIILEQLFVSSSRGTLFYKEIRISAGKKFNFYKFRIFKQSVIDKARKELKCVHTKPLEKDKKNLTYYGIFLKNIYMDEFPQLWNVFKGDMTMVGPRPTNLENSEEQKKAGNFTRWIIVCGLTGEFQAAKGNKKRKTQKEMDNDYIKFIEEHGGYDVLCKDLKIIFKTILTVLEAKGI